ncbi:hypothetical protein HD806DRAFT_551180 [Xylariaceae sp. AK1471]|nr:hypothetical protein HD806DRAFT_551180 [Xylariaceae sp. AK1471]
MFSSAVVEVGAEAGDRSRVNIQSPGFACSPRRHYRSRDDHRDRDDRGSYRNRDEDKHRGGRTPKRDATPVLTEDERDRRTYVSLVGWYVPPRPQGTGWPRLPPRVVPLPRGGSNSSLNSVVDGSP